MSPWRVIFMGTAELSCASLQALLASGEFETLAVVTQPDRPKGRQLKIQPSPVKESALRAGVPVLQPERARNPEFIEELGRTRPDLIVVAAYGQLLPQALLDLPRSGCVNVHTSLLPKYRGAAPIQWALLNDEPETGVTIMKMDAGLDTGPILSQDRTAIRPEDTAETLHERLASLGATLLLKTLPGYLAGEIKPEPQPDQGVTHAPKIKKEDGHIDWSKPARHVWNRVRGLVPWPGAFTFLPGQPQPHLLKIWHAEVANSSGPAGEILEAGKNGVVIGCGQQALRVLAVQREGGRRLPIGQFLAGHPLAVGLRLG